MRKVKIQVLQLFAVSLLFSACSVSDDFSNLKTTIDTSLPFAYLQMNDRELFDNSSLGDQIYVGKDDVLTFKNTISLKMLGKEEIRKALAISFENVSRDFNDVIGSLPLPPGGKLPQDLLRSEVKIDQGEGVVIDKLTFENGTVFFANNPLLNGVTCTILQVTKNGNPLVITTGQKVDLSSGWKIDLSGGNTLDLIYNGTYTPEVGGDATLNISFDNLVVESAEGFFGNQKVATIDKTLEIEESTLEFFGMVEDLYLSDPSILVTIDNRFDVPVGVVVSSLVINDGQKDVSIELKKAFNQSAFLLNNGDCSIALSNASTVSGKGLSELINKDLRKMAVAFEVILNPTPEQLFATTEEVPVVQKNTFSSEMSAEGDVGVIFPIDGYFKNLTYEDKFDLDVNLDEINVDNAQFVITGSNGMPIDLNITLYGVDGNGNETLFCKEPILIKASAVNVKPNDPAFKPAVIDQNNFQTIPLNVAVLNNLNDYQFIRYKIDASTYNEQNKQSIKLYSGIDFKINLTLGAKANIDL